MGFTRHLGADTDANNPFLTLSAGAPDLAARDPVCLLKAHCTEQMLQDRRGDA